MTVFASIALYLFACFAAAVFGTNAAQDKHPGTLIWLVIFAAAFLLAAGLQIFG